MSQNIELKARIESIDRAVEVAERLSSKPAEWFEQKDTYFRVGKGRLKLRQSPQLGDELIFYHRESASGPRGCRYFRQPTDCAEQILELLQRSCGSDVVVAKTRRLFWFKRVRIHLDDVRFLGSFLEFEAVLGESYEENGWDEQTGFEVVRRLRDEFQIAEKHLIGKSYRELMLQADNDS